MSTEQKSPHLYEEIASYLAELILKHIDDPNYRLPTEAEIAKLHNVSRITAIKAYQAIEAKGVIYRVKGKGTFISKNAQPELLMEYSQSADRQIKKVAAVFPLIDSLHILKIVAGITQAKKNFKLFVDSSEMSQEREEQLIEQYIRMGIDGLIIYPTDNENYSHPLLKLALQNFPVVMVDRYLTGLNFNYITTDHERMTSQGVEYLVSKNHKDILFFNANIKTNSALKHRKRAFINTLTEHALPTDYEFCFLGDKDNTSVSFGEAFNSYLKNNPQITAIVTADYASSLHLMQLLRILKIPANRYEIVYLDMTKENFTDTENPVFIEQDSVNIGKEAAIIMERNIENPNGKKIKIFLEPKLYESYHKDSE